MAFRILTFGTFDDLHPGHLAYLNQAAAKGELYVVVARDANVLRFKGRPALHTEDERVQAVRDAFPQAKVMLGDPDDFMVPVRAVKPDLIMLGYDQRLPPGITQETLGCAVVRAESFQPDVHKSSLRRMKS